jgi:hypothetical protein
MHETLGSVPSTGKMKSRGWGGRAERKIQKGKNQLGMYLTGRALTLHVRYWCSSKHHKKNMYISLRPQITYLLKDHTIAAVVKKT